MKNLLQNIEARLKAEISKRDNLFFLTELDMEECLGIVISTLYLYSRPSKSDDNRLSFTIIASAMGHAIRNHYKLKKDSALAVKAGAFFLYTFDLFEIVEVELKRGANNHATYFLDVKDDEAIRKLWSGLPKHVIQKLPSETPYAPWVTSLHATGAFLVKTGSKAVLKQITLEKTPLVFSCVNKMQATGWRINPEIFSVQKWALRHKASVFNNIWKILSHEAKASKLREVKTIFQIANRFVDKTFYHLYYMDFRSRIYPATAYLHEQGTDVAKGLIRRAEKKPLTKEGYYWLMIYLANCWAGIIEGYPLKTDKLPMNERYKWAVENEESFLQFATDPKSFTLWMDADAPWQFLSACYELAALRNWQFDNWGEGDLNDCFDNFDFPSDIVVYIDGTTNGLQHLTALTRDEVTATHVNLVPQNFPGDLYNYVGEQIWKDLQNDAEKLEELVKEECKTFIEDLLVLKKNVQKTVSKSDERAEALTLLREFKKEKEELANPACIIFWLKITKPSERRKIVKR